MPELPEVETTKRGLAPHLTGQRISSAIIRNARLRWPIPAQLAEYVRGQTMHAISRRGKYLLLDCGNGWLILHLGMSGSLQMVDAATPALKHDHFDLILENGLCMRLRDPRRFGAVLWIQQDVMQHPLLVNLGIEPLAGEFTGAWLHQTSRQRNTRIKQLLMNHHIVVGIGNIYANEALFHAGIHPETPAHGISLRRCHKLVEAVQHILQQAIAAGGSSLRDFVDSAGKPGYFQQTYQVYGRTHLPCYRCGNQIQHLRQGQRSTFYCPRCQT